MLNFSSKSSEFVWWKLEKSFFNFEEDICICSVYITPANSKHFGKNENDPYDDLQSELMHYSKLEKIMLMGDFNARKGLLSGTLGGGINDLQFLTISTDLNSNPDSETFTKLHSLDQSVNRYGRSLVNLCISNKLSILNGRVKGDLLGKFTCYQPNRASIVDYAVLSNALIKHVIYFHGFTSILFLVSLPYFICD